MNISNTNPLDNKIVSICAERDIHCHVSEYCRMYSEGRTDKIEALTESEKTTFLKNLLYLNDEFILNGIYDVAKDLGIVEKSISEMDGHIIDFLRAEGDVDFFTRKLLVSPDSKIEIEIVAPIKNLSYMAKLMIAQILGAHLLQKMERLN